MTTTKKRTPTRRLRAGGKWGDRFRERLALVLKACGWSRNELARQISRVRREQWGREKGEDVNPTRIAEWLNGKALPKSDTLWCIGKATGVEVDWLLSGETAAPRFRGQSRLVASLEADVAAAIERDIAASVPAPGDERTAYEWRVDGRAALERATDSLRRDASAYKEDADALRARLNESRTLERYVFALKRHRLSEFRELLPVAIAMKERNIAAGERMRRQYAVRLVMNRIEIDERLARLATQIPMRLPAVGEPMDDRFAEQLEHESMILGALRHELAAFTKMKH